MISQKENLQFYIISIVKKEQLLRILRQINKQILKTFIQLKQQFSAKQKQIPNDQITKTLKNWKQYLSVTVQQQFENKIKQLYQRKKEDKQFMSQSINYKALVKQMNLKYSKDQDYVECIKYLNSTIQLMKQFIRIKAIKDPTTSVFQSQIIHLKLLSHHSLTNNI